MRYHLRKVTSSGMSWDLLTAYFGQTIGRVEGGCSVRGKTVCGSDNPLYFFCCLKCFHHSLEDEGEEEGVRLSPWCTPMRYSMVTCVSPLSMRTEKWVYIRSFVLIIQGGVFINNEKHQSMVNGIEGLHQVYEDGEGFEAVLFAELEGGFERKNGVGAGFLLEATALILEAIVAHIRIHAMYNDGSEDIVRAVEETDGSPVV